MCHTATIMDALVDGVEIVQCRNGSETDWVCVDQEAVRQCVDIIKLVRHIQGWCIAWNHSDSHWNWSCFLIVGLTGVILWRPFEELNARTHCELLLALLAFCARTTCIMFLAAICIQLRPMRWEDMKSLRDDMNSLREDIRTHKQQINCSRPYHYPQV